MTDSELWKWGTSGPWITEDKTDTQWKLLFSAGDGTLYLAFQGSVSKIDWLHNFMFWVFPVFRKSYKRMPFVWFSHRGFYVKWKAVEDSVLCVVREHPGIKRVVVTGFSQGGAIAVRAHESLWFNFPQLRGKFRTVVFGAPRTIWFWNSWKLKERFRGLVRYEAGWDVVVKLPSVLFGYRHMGEKRKVGRKWYQPSLRFVKNHFAYEALV